VDCIFYIVQANSREINTLWVGLLRGKGASGAFIGVAFSFASRRVMETDTSDQFSDDGLNR
jgi:hypothetical protein